MYSFDLNAPLKLRIDEIQKNEFVYLKLPTNESSADEGLKSLFETLTQASNRLFFSINHLNDFIPIKKYETEYSISWFGVPVEVGSNQTGVRSSHTVYSNVDPLSIESFEAQKVFFQDQRKVIPEFILSGNHYQLGPTIVEFFNRFNLPFAFIKIEGAPESRMIQSYREVFESLRIKGFKQKIYFSFNNPHLEEWNLKTYNTFSGLQTVHLDLSNKCTHSCVFCGLWGPEFIDELKSQSEGLLKPEVVDFMNRQMPYPRTLEILNTLPETVHSVQFGGAGDPMTHPRWLDIFIDWRSRGFKIEVLTNFEYPSHTELEILHRLSMGRRSFDFMINVSAASAEVYKLIRPRQSSAVFQKVIENIRYVRDLKVRDGYGLKITMIHIINTLNFREAVKMVELAHELGTGIFLKPLEVHSEIHKNYSIKKEDYTDFQETMKLALAKADELKVKISMRELLVAIVQEEKQ